MNEEPGSVIRVLVAKRQSLFGSVLMRALCRHSEFDVVGYVSDIRQVVTETRQTCPDVVLLDRDLPEHGAIEAARMLRELAPTSKLVVLAADEDHDTLVRALRVGIKGFVTKAASFDELVKAMRAAHRGETRIPPRMIGELVERLVHGTERTNRDRDKLDRLTRQESVVLELLAKGASNQAIAEALTISPKTARTHVQNIFKKLEVHSRLEAVALATRADSLERTSV